MSRQIKRVEMTEGGQKMIQYRLNQPCPVGGEIELAMMQVADAVKHPGLFMVAAATVANAAPKTRYCGGITVPAALEQDTAIALTQRGFRIENSR